MAYKGSDGEKDRPLARCVHRELDVNMEVLDTEFAHCSDIIKKTFRLGCGNRACIIFAQGLTNQDLIQRDVITPLLAMDEKDLLSIRDSGRLPVTQLKFVDRMDRVIDEILQSNTVVLIEGLDYAISCSLKSFDKRSIEEPDIEKVIKGSHDGFVEALSTNVSLLRRRVKSTKLKVKMHVCGKRSRQDVAVVYIEDIANPELVKRVEDRIKSIDYDSLTGSGFIEQLTSDHPYCMFPQYQMTERPDRIVANIMEGRIAIILDGTPVVLTLPVNFFQFFQAVDDYNTAWLFGSFLRLLRFSAIVIAIFLPALYIALLTYHYESVPLTMLIPLLQSRSRVPFPPIIEALLMELTFELLREASIRLPQTLGPTVGIVGGLVIGQTAIEAGIVSNIMVIVVAITAISTFVVPTYDIGLLLRVTRFGAMVLAAVFGIAGLVIYGCCGFAYAVSLESLGQPYLQPVAPIKLKDMKDTFIRLPYKFMKNRPEIALPRDKTRRRSGNRR